MKTVSYWKIGSLILVSYSIIAGFLFDVPRLPILNETIRNLHFHVPMWFSMIFILGVSFFYSIRYLLKANTTDAIYSQQAAKVGIFFGILGIITGALWARFTWGTYWSGDPKQNASAIGIVIYLAHFVLTQSFKDEQVAYKVSAVYNVFAFCIFIPLIIILPRLTDSLHPGSGGNPGFNTYDLDANLRLVFYPAVLGWIGISLWLTSLSYRLEVIQGQLQEQD